MNFFKPSYFMIGQCLSNKSENATVSKTKKNKTKQGQNAYASKSLYNTFNLEMEGVGPTGFLRTTNLKVGWAKTQMLC